LMAALDAKGVSAALGRLKLGYAAPAYAMLSAGLWIAALNLVAHLVFGNADHLLKMQSASVAMLGLVAFGGLAHNASQKITALGTSIILLTLSALLMLWSIKTGDSKNIKIAIATGFTVGGLLTLVGSFRPVSILLGGIGIASTVFGAQDLVRLLRIETNLGYVLLLCSGLALYLSYKTLTSKEVSINLTIPTVAFQAMGGLLLVLAAAVFYMGYMVIQGPRFM
ncbi:MAG: hypothetical protein WAX89_01455, partial [Alphaproteobacteria bacterium]